MSNRFSDRIGVTKPPALAREEAPAALRTALWNAVEPSLFEGDWEDWRPRVQSIYAFLHLVSHRVSYEVSPARAVLEEYLFDCRWYEVYNLFEVVARLLAKESYRGRESQFYSVLNDLLRREGSPYRFVDGRLTPITDEQEITAVKAVLNLSDRLAGARTHITRAVELLGERPQPDNRNAIKEAISAVESALKILTGHDHADLKTALREFAKLHPMHEALFQGLDKLYGYTSNEHGLRHALLDADANVGFAEAKFMVVACSAFVGYLVARHAA